MARVKKAEMIVDIMQQNAMLLKMFSSNLRTGLPKLLGAYSMRKTEAAVAMAVCSTSLRIARGQQIRGNRRSALATGQELVACDVV